MTPYQTFVWYVKPVPDALSRDAVERYESALDELISGNWDAALAGLHDVPHWDGVVSHGEHVARRT